jgi:hypothetical protein
VLCSARLEERRKKMVAQPATTQLGKDHNIGLHKLLVSREAHPERPDNEYIDGIFADVGEHKAFHGIVKDRFRHHYKEKVTQWLTEQAMAG